MTTTTFSKRKNKSWPTSVGQKKNRLDGYANEGWGEGRQEERKKTYIAKGRSPEE
jgi:hypothetical protein